jgi:hypothetical protein
MFRPKHHVGDSRHAPVNGRKSGRQHQLPSEHRGKVGYRRRNLSAKGCLSTKDIEALKGKGMKSHVIIDPYTNRGIRLPIK